MATAVFSGTERRSGPGLLLVTALPAPRRDAASLLKGIDDEIARIRDEGVSAKDVARARNRIRLARATLLQETAPRASLFGEYETKYGGAEGINARVPRLDAVTPAAVQKAAGTYLTAAHRTILTVTPGGTRPPSAGRTRECQGRRPQPRAARPHADLEGRAAGQAAPPARIDARQRPDAADDGRPAGAAGLGALRGPWRRPASRIQWSPQHRRGGGRDGPRRDRDQKQPRCGAAARYLRGDTHRGSRSRSRRVEYPGHRPERNLRRLVSRDRRPWRRTRPSRPTN